MVVARGAVARLDAAQHLGAAAAHARRLPRQHERRQGRAAAGRRPAVVQCAAVVGAVVAYKAAKKCLTTVFDFFKNGASKAGEAAAGLL